MRCLLILTLLLAACNPENEKEQTLDLSYVAWACECANWATLDDIEKFTDNPDSLARRSIFVVPVDSALKLPDSLGRTGDVLRFTGQFDKEEGVPENIDYGGQKPDKARILRYTRYEIIKRDSGKYFPETDTLVVASRAAVFFGPDSQTMEKIMNDENLKFINSNGTSLMIKIDTLEGPVGVYLFDPAKPPRFVDMFNIEKEYEEYFKK